MHKILIIIFAICCSIIFATNTNAQGLKDPTHWTYEVKKLSKSEYQLSFKLKLDQGWHIWALEAGGDGLQIVPSFNFEANENVELIEDMKEEGDLISQEMEGVEGIVNYYSNKVAYIQIVRGSPGTVVKGTHEYQVCNDMMCLPSKQADFSFTLK